MHIIQKHTEVDENKQENKKNAETAECSEIASVLLKTLVVQIILVQVTITNYNVKIYAEYQPAKIEVIKPSFPRKDKATFSQWSIFLWKTYSPFHFLALMSSKENSDENKK